MDKLILNYKFDPSYHDENLPRDDFGRLSLRFFNEHFSGSGGFWVQWQDLAEFGEKLDQYPIKEDEPIEAQWGYEMQEGDDLILRIAVAQKNKVGDLTVSVVIADDHDQSQRLQASFRTGYAALRIFREDISKLMREEVSEAVLHGF